MQHPDWSSLGLDDDLAVELPRLLSALRAAPDDGRVLASLEHRIAHQGTVVPSAAIACVPFLVELGVPSVIALLGRLSSGGREALDAPVEPALRAAVRARAEVLHDAFASDEPLLRAAGAYALVLSGELTEPERGRLAARAADAEPSLLVSLARVAPEAHLSLFRTAAADTGARRAAGLVGLVLGGALEERHLLPLATLLREPPAGSVWPWAEGEPRRALLDVLPRVDSRAARALFAQVGEAGVRATLALRMLAHLPPAIAPSTELTDDQRDVLTLLAGHEEAFTSMRLRRALAARGLPDEPQSLGRWLVPGVASPLEEAQVVIEGRPVALRDTWVAACTADAPDTSLGGLARAIVAALGARGAVGLVPALRALEVPWGFSARRAIACLLAASAAAERSAVEELAARLEREGPPRSFSAGGTVVDTQLLPLVRNVLRGEGLIGIAPRKRVPIAELLARALA